MQRHDAYLSTRTQAAALKAVIRSGRGDKRGPSAYGSPEVYAGGAGAAKSLSASKTRRGGRKQRSRVKAESEGSSSGAEESERRPRRQAGRCAWPDKPRLPDEKFKEFRTECRKMRPETCFAFLVGTCREASCMRSHDVPTAFEAIKKKFR